MAMVIADMKAAVLIGSRYVSNLGRALVLAGVLFAVITRNGTIGAAIVAGGLWLGAIASTSLVYIAVVVDPNSVPKRTLWGGVLMAAALLLLGAVVAAEFIVRATAYARPLIAFAAVTFISSVALGTIGRRDG